MMICFECRETLSTKWERQFGLCNGCQAERDGVKGTEKEPEFEFRSLPLSEAVRDEGK